MPAATSCEEGPDGFLNIAGGTEDDSGASQEPGPGTGDYATRLEEVLGESDDEEDEGFLYEGEDSHQVSETYNEQLQGFLQGLDEPVGGHEDAEEERQVEEELQEKGVFTYEQAPKVEAMSDRSPSPSTESLPMSNFRPGSSSTIINGSTLNPHRPFLHPTISRLRSFAPPQHQKRMSSVTSVPNVSLSPSHFSAISRTSSVSNLHAPSDSVDDSHAVTREAFRWAVLRDICHQIYPRKATSILGSFHGSPTVLAANGLICIGTDRGRVLVFDFKQQLKCVCGTDDSSESAGPVSALSLSHDHTYLAVGHTSGHISLYDVSHSQTPSRSVPPTSLPAVASGRKEGHIQGSRILSLGFVGARHTAIVSADENGLAFYHSLGKVLFVEASDTLRILGKYPDVAGDPTSLKKATKISDSSSAHTNGGGAIPSNPVRPRPWKPRKSNTILAMSPLPLGTAAHPIEAYHLIALLTPAKLVIVGLKPSPRTWFRRHRENATDASKWRGCLAWFPSVESSIETNENIPMVVDRQANGKESTKLRHLATRPVLAYSWDRTLYLLRVSESKVKQTVQSVKNPGKTTTVEVGKVELEEVARWSSESDYLAIQWLNAYQILALTATHLEVWETRTASRVEYASFDAMSLMPYSDSGEIPDDERIAHSMRVYKGKVFLLGRHELKVGTLLSWADRILSFVEDGDFLSAIESTRAYYVGTAPGNKMGLPDDPVAMRVLVGRRMRDLMTASARYAFAEDRMTDNTHVTPDGRGVDRTSLFEGLVTVCANACIALDDFEFLFEDLFENYDNACIAPIFLTRLEPLVLDGTIRSIPPRITQRLISMHEDRGELDKAERLIWHIDPDCLDINQAITLCRRNGLYDALIYVHTRSLQDFVTPLVELLGLVRRIQQHRREQRTHPHSAVSNAFFTSPASSHHSMETLVPDAYKIYTYLADVLSGLTYPSQLLMPEEEASRAKKDVYAFLFAGRSYVWPLGEGGKLVLTSDEEGGTEPTYPYVRLLLQFDAEAFLHALDIAFEDAYFNDDTQGVDRFLIVQILLEILSSPGLSSEDITMLNIFIARNVPKYPQSIHTYMAPSTLHRILVGLAEDTDQSTREDRQLASEFLLSVYTPHNSERMVDLFEDAGFFRILRSWYRQEHKWASLVSTYLRDPDVDSTEVFSNLDEVLTTASRADGGTLSVEVLGTIMDAIPLLWDTGPTETAILIDKHAPESHAQVLDILGSSSYKQFAYLRCLAEPSALPDEAYWADPTIRQLPPSSNLDTSLKELYMRLLCQHDTPGVIRYLSSLGQGAFDWDVVVSICEERGVNEAVIWCLDKRGDSMGALKKLQAVDSHLAAELGEQLISEKGLEEAFELQHLLDELTAIGEIGLHVCREHSAAGDIAGSSVEEMWFHLLSSQIDVVQTVSGFCSSDLRDEDPKAIQERRTLESLRALVQGTFASLVALGSSSALSFPRLFKRLVDSTSRSRGSSRSSYSEFRLVLTGMLDSYRGEGDLLLITNRLVERDLFTTVQELAKRRAQGSRARSAFCASCRMSLQNTAPKPTQAAGNGIPPGKEAEAEGWVMQRMTGLPYHRRCLPFDH